MLFRTTLIAFCFLIRANPIRTAQLSRTWIARAAALVPMGILYAVSGDGMNLMGTALIILGTSLVCLSLIDLGKSFGVSPAVRPYVGGGVYRFISHPMYLGHVFTEAGMFIASPTLRNGLIIGVSWTFYWIRTRWESELISDHLSEGSIKQRKVRATNDA